MRHTSFLLSLISSSLIITSASAQTPSKFDYSFYAGINLGYQHTKHHYKITQTEPTIGPIPGKIRHLKKSPTKNGFLPELYFGYRHYMNPMFLGIELTANLGMAKTTFKSTSDAIMSSHSLEDKYTLKPQIVIGGAIANNITLFAKAGPCISKHKFSTTLLTDNKATKNTKTLVRFAGSVGIEYHHCHLYGTRLEVGFTPGKSAKAKQLIDEMAITFDRNFKTQNISTTASIFFKL